MSQSLPSGAVRHLVMCRFRPDAGAERIAALVDAFRDLQNKIPGIIAFEYGENNSPEGMNRGMACAFLLTFESAAARDIYLPHPEHKNFVSAHGAAFEEVQVIDYCPLP